ncbi:amidohydrolase family protein [Paenibacillus sp. PAMC21692]|uniref:amidohydrolase family protein n=1 Tax=Paenibacillus sp. PAMC21692 TaxID=2762320 RepID=UPI00164DA3FD|nr:amidohydrolase family protein [Paenibacillus sp. PAMC21692]QNK59525.1 amidohydrolase family protein [Paenibacillus sp. PAMC21692]
MLKDAGKHGIPLNDVLVIDVHGHLGVHPDPFVPEHDEKIQAGLLNPILERVGIDYIIVSMLKGLNIGELEANLYLAELMQSYRKILGYITYIPSMISESLTIAEQCFRLSDRFVGMKIHPDVNKYPINGSGYMPLWEYANEKELIVLVHTWNQSPYANPELLHDIARTYKDATILVGHSGGMGHGITTAIDLSNNYDNVYLDLTGAFIYSGKSLVFFVQQTSSDKLLFSSDSIYNNVAWEIGNILYSRVSDEIKLKVLGLNAKRLLSKFIAIP